MKLNKNKFPKPKTKTPGVVFRILPKNFLRSKFKKQNQIHKIKVLARNRGREYWKKRNPPKPARLAPPTVIIYSGEKVSLATAKLNKLKKYFTGEPCVNGHIDQRYTVSNLCIQCAKEHAVRNKSKIAEYYRNKRRAAGCIEKLPNIERQKAIEEGKTRYWSDKPCPKGHVGWRLVKGYKCVECKNIARRKGKPPKSILTPEQKKERRRLQYKAKSANRRKNAGRRLKWSELKKILIIQKYKCANCFVDIKNKSHADHIIPVAKGGKSIASNIQMLCPQCNIKKSDKDPIDFAQENGRLL